MKAVYRSIKPYWLYLILIGKKTIEIGKTFPKAEDWNKEVFLHCSKDMKSFNRIPEKDREWMRKYLGKCACRFVCDYMTGLKADNMIQAYYNNTKGTCLTDAEIKQYANGKKVYYWHISNLVIYDKPRELSEFKQVRAIRGYHKKDELKTEGINIPQLLHSSRVEVKYLTRPPQSWCYVEEAC